MTRSWQTNSTEVFFKTHNSKLIISVSNSDNLIFFRKCQTSHDWSLNQSRTFLWDIFSKQKLSKTTQIEFLFLFQLFNVQKSRSSIYNIQNLNEGTLVIHNLWAYFTSNENGNNHAWWLVLIDCDLIIVILFNNNRKKITCSLSKCKQTNKIKNKVQNKCQLICCKFVDCWHFKLIGYDGYKRFRMWLLFFF